MLGLTVDMRQESLFLPFQTQLLKKKRKEKQNNPNQWDKKYIVSIK